MFLLIRSVLQTVFNQSVCFLSFQYYPYPVIVVIILISFHLIISRYILLELWNQRHLGLIVHFVQSWLTQYWLIILTRSIFLSECGILTIQLFICPSIYDRNTESVEGPAPNTRMQDCDLMNCLWSYYWIIQCD